MKALPYASRIENLMERELPTHVAIVMDGNRRWSRKNGLSLFSGHWKGEENLQRVLETAIDLGISHLTVYAFSTENWKRPKEEISSLMRLFITYLKKRLLKMCEQGVRLRIIGDISPFPDALVQVIEESREKTKDNTKIDLILAMNYGGRDEICRAAAAFAREVAEGKKSPEALTENLFESYLDTAEIPSPDLMIRSGGEQRLSNFLLWQLSYAEFYFTKTHWPDFLPEDFLDAIELFQKRHRRMGEL